MDPIPTKKNYDSCPDVCSPNDCSPDVCNPDVYNTDVCNSDVGATQRLQHRRLQPGRWLQLIMLQNIMFLNTFFENISVRFTRNSSASKHARTSIAYDFYFILFDTQTPKDGVSWGIPGTGLGHKYHPDNNSNKTMNNGVIAVSFCSWEIGLKILEWVLDNSIQCFLVPRSVFTLDINQSSSIPHYFFVFFI